MSIDPKIFDTPTTDMTPDLKLEVAYRNTIALLARIETLEAEMNAMRLIVTDRAKTMAEERFDGY